MVLPPSRKHVTTSAFSSSATLIIGETHAWKGAITSLSNRRREPNLLSISTVTRATKRATMTSQGPNDGASRESEVNPTDVFISALMSDGEPRQILALIALSRLPGEQALPLLRQSGALTSEFRKTRIAALDALGKTRIHTECANLVEILQTDSDHSIRAAAAGALSNIFAEGDLSDEAQPPPMKERAPKDGLFTNAVQALRTAAKNDDHFIVRYSAIVALGNLRDGDRETIELLLPLVEKPSTAPLETASAIDAMGEIISAHDVQSDWLFAVTSRASDKDDLIRAAVVRTLNRWKTVAGVPDTLSSMLRNEIRYGRSSFVLGLLDYIVNTDGAT